MDAYIAKCFPHQGAQLELDALMTAMKQKNKLGVYACLVKEFVPMADDALVAALLYQGLGGFEGFQAFADSTLPDVSGEAHVVCKRYLAHMLSTLESLYTQMDMTPRAMMLSWALKGALDGKPRSYGEDNCRYWNPVEAAQHDFCYEAYLEEVHNFVE